VDILDQRGGGGGGIMVKNNTHTHTTQICVWEEEDVTEDCTLLHFLSTTCWGWHKTKARKKSQEEKTFSNLTNPFQLHRIGSNSIENGAHNGLFKLGEKRKHNLACVA
jgi:hypothetical protein